VPVLSSSAPKAIAMWDFSWLERRWEGGGYEDWAQALDELVERGYDVVRIDAFPHLIDVDPSKSFDLIPVWDQHDWGSPTAVTVQVQPALNEFIRLAGERGVAVSLSSWFRRDTTDARLLLRTPADLARAWNVTLRGIEAAGLLEHIWFVDLCNEWANPTWAPYLYDWSDDAKPESLLRTGEVVRAWTAEALAGVRAEFPGLPLCFSFSDQLASWREQDVSDFDLIEPHVWMAQDVSTGFYAELNYDMRGSSFDPEQYRVLAGGADTLYRSNPDGWKRRLSAAIADMADWSRATGLPLVTTECWAIVNWKDGEGLPWEWVKELCAHGVREAIDQGRWIGMATSNFCGPQYRGMWNDVDWHRHQTDAIKSSHADAPALTL
jgi:Sugar-binding cellulase-like